MLRAVRDAAYRGMSASTPERRLPPIPTKLSWAALLFIGASLCATPAHATWQNFQASAGGLSENNIFCISESPAGGVWVGTAAPAASHFDGVRWRTVTDSIPPGKVRAAFEDRAGREWFGTDNGAVAMFDGRRWSRFGPLTGELPSNVVTAGIEDRAGDIWFGTSAGLSRYQPVSHTWTTYLAGAGQLVNPTITRLFEDSRGQLWAATIHGVSVLDPSRTTWTSYTKSNSGLAQDSVTAVCEDRRGRMWFGTSQGVYLLSAGAWSQIAQIPGLPNNIVLAIARDSSGRMWLAGSDGVAHTEGRTFRADRVTSDGVGIGPIANLLVDSSGNLWLGGTSSAFFGWFTRGLFRFDGTTWNNFFSSTPSFICPPGSSTNIPSFNVLGSNCLAASLQDQQGNHWFASQIEGLSELDANGAWRVIHRSPSTPVSDTLTSIAQDHDGTVWFGSAFAGVTSRDSSGANWQAYTSTEGLAANSVHTLFVDSRGALWVGTGAGASRLATGTWTNFLTGGPPTDVQHITEDSGGRVWLQTSQGLYSVDTPASAARVWTTADGLPDDIVTTMLAARDGSMWFGTARGASRLASGLWRTWNSLGTLGDSSIAVLREDRTGGVWAGTDIDAARWDGSQWTAYHFPQQLAGLPVTDFFADSSGTVWVFTGGGTSRFSGRAWKNVGGLGNGLPSSTITSSLEDTQLSSWFTSLNGLAEYQPDRVAPQTVFVNQPPLLLGSRIASFVFGAGYGEVADLEYSYSLDGAPYSAWGTDNTFNSSGNADGMHTFRVRARDWVGNVDPTPASYTFEVDATPPPALIASPAFGLPVRGRIAIKGTAADPRFHDFVVQARPTGAAAWTGPGVITLASSTKPVTADTLATWDTTLMPDGNYDLRLVVTDTLGLVGPAQGQVIVDNVAPFANVTSPVTLVDKDGGDVYTTNAEAHVYFPPNAFDADPTVSIDSTGTPAAPDTLGGNAIRVSAGWTIGWTKASLIKPGTLELRPNRSGAALAIWRDDGGGQGTRIGGTAQQSGALAITLSSAGRYAVYAEGAVPSGSGGILALALTPRAFSPTGTFAAREASIGFTLARSGTADVKLYNRAGRLVRTVARGMSAEAGANLLRWDGRDDNGHVVDAGLYLVTVEALGQTKTETLAVVR
jgi:ligand-binding sensor domain-containing protein